MDPQTATTLLWVSTGFFLVCQAFVAIWVLADTGFVRGILAFLFFPYTYYWGWKDWDFKLRPMVMTLWTTALLSMIYFQVRYNIL